MTLDMAAVAALIWLAFINLHRFDLNWDSVEYHLPFAALRAGLMPPGAFEMRARQALRFEGFPPLLDWVQGELWRLTGRPEAAQLVSPIALAMLAWYARWVTGVRALWPLAIVAGIPITLTALNSANADLWSNAFVCVYLLAAFRAARQPGEDWAVHTLIAAAALAMAVNSKIQFFVIGAAAQLIQAAAILFLIWRDRRPDAARRRWRSLALTAALAPLVFYTPIRNAVTFSNPVYPFAAKAFGVTLPGLEKNTWVGPRRLAKAGRLARYWLSQLDFDAINRRAAGFNQDQGGQPEGADGNRMGGALSVLLIGSAGALAIGLRRRGLAMEDWVALAAAGALLAAVIAFPGSNELRYFCFVNIMTSLVALAVVQSEAAEGDPYAAGLLAGLRLLLVGSVVFTSFATGLRQLGWVDARTLDEIVEQRGDRGMLAYVLRDYDTLCYVRQDGYAFFFSPLLNVAGRGHDYRIVVRNYDFECPPGSAVIR